MSFLIDDILKNTCGVKEQIKKTGTETTKVTKQINDLCGSSDRVMSEDVRNPMPVKPIPYFNNNNSSSTCKSDSENGIVHQNFVLNSVERKYDRPGDGLDNVTISLDNHYRNKYNNTWSPIATDRMYFPYYGPHIYSDPSYVLNGLAQNVVRSRYWPQSCNYSWSYANDVLHHGCTHYSKRKGGQIRFTPLQTQALERRFITHKYLSPDDRRRLADMLKLSDRQVKTWFQNRRAKWRRSNNISTSTDDEKLISMKRSGTEDDVDDVFDSPQHSPLITVTE